jgi:molybdenum cofactor cytidylyltransferase
MMFLFIKKNLVLHVFADFAGGVFLTTVIVLAAGKSSRFGSNKMMFMVDKRPLLSYTIKSLRKVADKIVVVTGRYHQEINEFFTTDPSLKIVENENYENGMFTSVKTGVKEAIGDFFIIPGDYPLIEVGTYRKLMNANEEIRVPTCNGRRGHPIFFPAKYKEPLLGEPDDANLKLFQDRFEVNYIPVDDKGVVFDIDTIADMDRFIQENKRRLGV